MSFKTWFQVTHHDLSPCPGVLPAFLEISGSTDLAEWKEQLLLSQPLLKSRKVDAESIAVWKLVRPLPVDAFAEDFSQIPIQEFKNEKDAFEAQTTSDKRCIWKVSASRAIASLFEDGTNQELVHLIARLPRQLMPTAHQTSVAKEVTQPPGSAIQFFLQFVNYDFSSYNGRDMDYVKVPRSSTVAEWKATLVNTFELHIGSNRVSVWMLAKPWNPVEVCPKDFFDAEVQRCKNERDASRAQATSDKYCIWEPHDARTIASVFKDTNAERLQDSIHILLRLPRRYRAPDHGGRYNKPMAAVELSAQFTRAFIETGCLTKVNSWDQFDDDDLRPNKIERFHSSSNLPAHVRDFIAKLEAKRCVEGEARDVVRARRREAPYFTEVEPPSELTVEANPPPRMARISEVLHTEYLATPELERNWVWPLNFRNFTRAHAEALFFSAIGNYVLSKKMEPEFTYKRSEDDAWPINSWPIPIVVRLDTFSAPEYKTYIPQNAFAIWASSIPYALFEVEAMCTTPYKQDRYRVIFEGAWFVRFANAHFGQFRERKNFVLPVYYIDKTGRVDRYVFFQTMDKPNLVYFCIAGLALDEADGRVDLARQLYNLVDFVPIGGGGNHTAQQVLELSRLVNSEKKRLKWRTFEPPTRVTYRSARSESFEDPDEESCSSSWRSRRGPVGKGTVASSKGAGVELREKGYHVTQDHGDYPSNILKVRKGTNANAGTIVIAKRMRKSSREAAILQSLKASTGSEGREHIIGLIETVSTASATWLIMPMLLPLGHAEVCHTPNAGSKLSWGLIKGLAYLHERLIAHRDIKPHNLIVDVNKSCCLKIIDFDTALQLESEEDVVDGFCGTEGWIAPEVEEREPYSPIKADRWSCGQVIPYILDLHRTGEEEDINQLTLIGDGLTCWDAHERWSLSDWPMWEGGASHFTDSDEPASSPSRIRPRSSDGEELRAAKKARCVADPAG